MSIITKQMTLVEMLQHMKELAEAGLEKDQSFDQALSTYLISREGASKKEMLDAINFLDKNSVGHLNTENMMASLGEICENM